jgi:hypothetical protein
MSEENIPKHESYAICPGCLTYNEVEKVREQQKEDGHVDGAQCTIPPYNKGKVCPCSKCLVKMMCENMCEDLLQYKEKFLYGDDFTRPLPK